MNDEPRDEAAPAESPPPAPAEPDEMVRAGWWSGWLPDSWLRWRPGWWPGRRRAALIVALSLGLILVAWLSWTWARWPNVEALRTVNPSSTAFIEMYRSRERAEGGSGRVEWSPVAYDRISANLKRAVVASEDTEFFFHDGFSSHEMQQAIKKAIREREAPRGASTITQQLAKNLWLTPSRSITRKLREALLARQLEKELTKARILELYLNVVEFGPGVYGAEAAARHYFGVPAAYLSPRQGAMLAAGLPRPKQWNPSSTSENYARRVEQILEIERQLEYLDRFLGPTAPGRVEVEPPAVPDGPAPAAVAADSS